MATPPPAASIEQLLNESSRAIDTAISKHQVPKGKVHFFDMNGAKISEGNTADTYSKWATEQTGQNFRAIPRNTRTIVANGDFNAGVIAGDPDNKGFHNGTKNYLDNYPVTTLVSGNANFTVAYPGKLYVKGDVKADRTLTEDTRINGNVKLTEGVGVDQTIVVGKNADVEGNYGFIRAKGWTKIENNIGRGKVEAAVVYTPDTVFKSNVIGEAKVIVVPKEGFNKFVPPNIGSEKTSAEVADAASKIKAACAGGKMENVATGTHTTLSCTIPHLKAEAAAVVKK